MPTCDRPSEFVCPTPFGAGLGSFLRTTPRRPESAGVQSSKGGGVRLSSAGAGQAWVRFCSPAASESSGGDLRARDLFTILEEMPNRSVLGEMELLVLLAVLRLENDAYGVPISKELLNLAGKDIALGSIYAALERIERKGLVTSSLGEPTPERGGRAKRYFRITAAGVRAVKETQAALTKLWSGIPVLEGKRS